MLERECCGVPALSGNPSRLHWPARVIPILIGGKKLFELYQQRDRTEETLEQHSDAKTNEPQR
jgi:hypothetical protein